MLLHAVIFSQKIVDGRWWSGTWEHLGVRRCLSTWLQHLPPSDLNEDSQAMRHVWHPSVNVQAAQRHHHTYEVFSVLWLKGIISLGIYNDYNSCICDTMYGRSIHCITDASVYNFSRRWSRCSIMDHRRENAILDEYSAININYE